MGKNMACVFFWTAVGMVLMMLVKTTFWGIMISVVMLLISYYLYFHGCDS
ncbi:MAG: hypothetical protein MJ134_02735 [Lachnospiraceae bacterium]|nr:hypothetical protein [Lachnospiraceae bacterium]